MPTLKISKELHLLLKQYAIIHNIKLETFVNNEFSNNKKLLSLKQKIKSLRFK